MKLFKVKYYIKRLGIIGVLKRILNKLGIIEFDIYEYIYRRYYSKLKKQEYEDELIEWYKFNTEENKNPLVNPQTFNEKIQWLKIFDNSSLKTKCADKYNVREYIIKKIGKEYLVPLYGSWNTFDEIDFSTLPDRMIFKSTTGSARYKIIKNKEEINYLELKKTMDNWRRLPFGYAGMEIHYIDIDRKIICEKLLDMDGPSVADYKIHCFNGKPLIIEYLSDRIGHNVLESWYDISWSRLNITMDSSTYRNHPNEIERPKQLDKMLEIAEILSEDFIYVRVDLYQINGKIFFGELTFTPCNGIDKWKGKESQIYVGELLRLPYEEYLDNERINKIIEALKK